MAELIGNTEGT